MRFDRSLPSCFSAVMQLRCGRGLETSAETLRQLMLSSEREHVLIVRSELGDNVGYVAYAMIDEFTLAELTRNPGLLLRSYEHSEGDICFVLDMVVLPTRFREFMRALLRRRWRPAQVAYLRCGRVVFRERPASARGGGPVPLATTVTPCH